MKKYIYIGIVILAGAGLLVACGGGGSSNSNSSSSQIDQGQVEVYNSETTSIDDVAVLNINTVFNTGDNSKIDSLKMCNLDKCWTLLGNNKSLKKSGKKSVTQKLTDNKSTEKLGSFAVSEEGTAIDRLKYSYKGKEGEIKLDNPISLNKSTSNNIYLNLDDVLTVPLSSLSLPNLGSNYFQNEGDFKVEIENGVIVEVEQGSSEQPSFLYANRIGEVKNQNVQFNSFLISFYSFPSESNQEAVTNAFPNSFSKNIKVYIPIIYSDISISEIKVKYQLSVNNKNISYDIATLNNKKYIVFSTSYTTFKVMLNGNLEVPQ